MNLYKTQKCISSSHDFIPPIPKIIHQIWIQGWDQIPNNLFEYHTQCKEINDDYMFIHWDEKSIITLLNEFYPVEFLNLYNKYQVFAQKADFARYVILYIFGGIYIDTDTICRKKLCKFLNNGVFFTTIKDLVFYIYPRYSNGIIGAIPNHPLFPIIFKNLFDRQNQIDNITYSTGTDLFYTSVIECQNTHKINDMKLIDSKYLHPCSAWEIDPQKCAETCKDCHIVHINNLSWSRPMRAIKYIINNIFIIFIILIVILGMVLGYYVNNKTPINS